jgi:hypothetical protein
MSGTQLSADCSQTFGSDLQISATGDILLASGVTYTRQRILRRLLTNAGDYIWQLAYGAGLRQQVGNNTNLLQIQNIIRSQIFQEASVAQQPAPIVTATSDATGDVTVTIIYFDAATGLQQAPLSFVV